jgi:hypothetical protein
MPRYRLFNSVLKKFWVFVVVKMCVVVFWLVSCVWLPVFQMNTSVLFLELKCALKMEVVLFSEMSVTTCKTKQPHSPEDCTAQRKVLSFNFASTE